MYIYLESNNSIKLPQVVVKELQLQKGDVLECSIVNEAIQLKPISTEKNHLRNSKNDFSFSPPAKN
ncbi:AbrB/MazE/SpoVT family DNA-binding domain-containing protein [Anaeromicropila populeti]|uniref:Looped-hinge helix DNA binding domain-containing protein, AbrB family n=1 Tax=Anaeromicropila populeti TaxID=37658 RepID=A0A1I6IP25_9FIRM|nr:hypothetical protein [Anaeromicropila populeti]SFR68000.1 hypothetical protein SAMN05661086_00914 [Anaeromicropila populeti]